MKRMALLVPVLCLIASPALAVDQNNTGCGLGTMVFEGQDGLASQVLAVTTNGTFANQTFGITSGTLNCDKPAKFAQSEQLQRFVGENMDALAMDISRGDGEYLRTLAVLLDVPAEERAGFFATLQANFATIYPDAGVTHTDVLTNLEALLQG